MTEKKTKVLKAKRGMYSLRTGLLILVIVGILAAAAVYVIVHAVSAAAIDKYCITESRKESRRDGYFADLQRYIKEKDIGTADLSELNDWLDTNRYVYLLLYKDDLMIWSSEKRNTHMVEQLPGIGLTVGYPNDEEMRKKAEEQDMYALALSDMTVLCSIAEFTEYIYYDIANIGSLLAAMVTLAAILILYFHWISGRISLLAQDVTAVTAGDMSHAIHFDGMNDEISALSAHVEGMRSSIVNTLESEREAINANTELITAMSHDIRTPLTVLLGYLDILQLHTENATNAKYLKAAEDTALRLKGLSDDMFRYFVAFSGRDMDISLQPYEAEVLLSQLLSEHVLLLRENGYDIRVHTQEALPEDLQIFTDAPKLMRIIDNIFSNLSKYADRSFPIFITSTLGFASISLHFNNKMRNDNAIVESSGIGLRTCERLAQAMRAVFSVETTETEYSVRLTLPTAAPDATDTEKEGTED